MTTDLRLRYDGRVFVPEPGQEVDLPVGHEVRVRVESVEQVATDGNGEGGAATVSDGTPGERFLRWYDGLPPLSDADLPTDGAAQVDHYLYGAPKRP